MYQKKLCFVTEVAVRQLIDWAVIAAVAEFFSFANKQKKHP